MKLSSSRLIRLSLLSAAGLLCAAPAGAQDPSPVDTSWAVTQVADLNYINREPTVGANGKVAWHSHGKIDPGEEFGGSAIFLWENGQLKNLTEGASLYERASHIHPIIRGDRVLWHTTRNNIAHKQRAFTWVLQEVPEGKDTGQRDHPCR